MGRHKEFCKVLAVIESCNTKEQLKVASAFSRQYFKQHGTAQYMCGFRDRIVQKKKEIKRKKKLT